ncbi:MAG: hypothetical protein IT353_09690 [Gemmatimonadaceae bacterium]|nr:hypothetical protein [Gemmatimonadaceae bacterium]
MKSRLSRMLRGKHHDVWQQFATDIQGTYHEGSRTTDDEVHVKVHGHDVVLQADVTMLMVGKVMIPVFSTRLVTLLPAVPSSRFSISKAVMGTGLARWFGAQDIAVGDETFDEGFVLKGVDPAFVRRVFDNVMLRTLLQDYLAGDLSRRDDDVMWSDPTPGMDPMELTMHGLIDDIDVLRHHFDIFSRVLERQPEAGSRE